MPCFLRRLKSSARTLSPEVGSATGDESVPRNTALPSPARRTVKPPLAFAETSRATFGEVGRYPTWSTLMSVVGLAA